MFKKVAIALLVLTVFGAAGAAVAYNNTTVVPASAASEPLAEEVQVNGVGTSGQHGQQVQQEEQQGEREIAAQGSLGDAWLETGMITELEDVGLSMILVSGETAYVELGPADYWQAQGVVLEVGQSITVAGSINEGMIHAMLVMSADGQTLQLRNEFGQPMWSGGIDPGQGQGEAGNGEAQVAADEWVTIEGTLMSFQGGSMTMSAVDGSIVTFKTGQPRFFAEQGVSFEVGEQMVVVGYYKGEQFQAGDITKVSSGARVMLLDPNGRPLWAGPGNGQGNSAK